MLVLTHPSSDHYLPQEPRRRSHGRIVWQPHYEGFATVAYRDGRAIAGISGPWSNQYVLIWRQPAQPIRQVEVFDSLEEARQAVALGSSPPGTQLETLLHKLRREVVLPRPSWLRRFHTRLTRWLRIAPSNARAPRVRNRARARFSADETDLSGLNFRAIR